MTEGLTDAERLLVALRAAGRAGMHSHEIRRAGISGNPSQRVSELRARGHNIETKRESIGRRPGARYFIRPAGVGAGSRNRYSSVGTASSDPGGLVKPAGVFDDAGRTPREVGDQEISPCPTAPSAAVPGVPARPLFDPDDLKEAA